MHPKNQKPRHIGLKLNLTEIKTASKLNPPNTDSQAKSKNSRNYHMKNDENLLRKFYSSESIGLPNINQQVQCTYSKEKPETSEHQANRTTLKIRKRITLDKEQSISNSIKMTFNKKPALYRTPTDKGLKRNLNEIVLFSNSKPGGRDELKPVHSSSNITALISNKIKLSSRLPQDRSKGGNSTVEVKLDLTRDTDTDKDIASGDSSKSDVNGEIRNSKNQENRLFGSFKTDVSKSTEGKQSNEDAKLHKPVPDSCEQPIKSPSKETQKKQTQDNRVFLSPLSSSYLTNPQRQEPNQCSDRTVSVSTLLNTTSIPISTNHLTTKYSNYEPPKFSSKRIGEIRGYAVNTYHGLVRPYNEDRVSIILNVARQKYHSGHWPSVSLFAIYDGHGGSGCSDFLRDRLHNRIIQQETMITNPKEAITNGFKQTEDEFIRHVMNNTNGTIDRSGSCALVCLVIDCKVYVANLGDSRALVSLNGGGDFRELSFDHKPSRDSERFRIEQAGGRVYQTQTQTNHLNLSPSKRNQILLGPCRILPGRLSVSRSFGDIETKMPQYGGMESVLIAVPEILEYSISKETDFIVMGCDGIFDHVENKEIIEAVWMTMGACGKEDIHSQAAQAVDMVIKCSLARKSFDNVTAIMICFDGMERRLGAEIKKPESPRKIDDSQFSSSHVQSCRNRLYSGNLSLWNANETAKDEKNPNSTKNKHRNLFNSKTVLVKPAYHSNSKQINLRLPLKKDSAFNQPLSHLHKNSAYSQKSLEGQLTEKKT